MYLFFYFLVLLLIVRCEGILTEETLYKSSIDLQLVLVGLEKWTIHLLQVGPSYHLVPYVWFFLNLVEHIILTITPNPQTVSPVAVFVRLAQI